MKKRRICDVAAEVLRETDNSGVMWGDIGLLDMIAERAGVVVKRSKYRIVCPLAKHERVINALSRCPGELIPGTTLIGRRRRVRIFWLPGHEPKWAKREVIG